MIAQTTKPRAVDHLKMPIQSVLRSVSSNLRLEVVLMKYFSSQEIAELMSRIEGDIVASVPMTDFIKGYQSHKYVLPK